MAQAAFDAANNASGTIGFIALNKANAAFDQANTATVLAQAAFNAANTAFTTSILSDISNQFDTIKCVFNLTIDQANVINIVDSKYLDVVVNGAKLSPYIKQLTYPWVVTYDSFKGYRVVSSNTNSQLIVYNAPAYGDQAILTLINSSSISSLQTKKYPYSAATIALGD